MSSSNDQQSFVFGQSESRDFGRDGTESLFFRSQEILLRHSHSILFICNFYINHKRTSRINNSIIAIHFEIVSSIESSSTDNCFKFELASRVSKFFLIYILVEFGHFQSIIPLFVNKSIEFFLSRHLSKWIVLDPLRSEFVEIHLPVLILKFHSPLYNALVLH